MDTEGTTLGFVDGMDVRSEKTEVKDDDSKAFWLKYLNLLQRRLPVGVGEGNEEVPDLFIF